MTHQEPELTLATYTQSELSRIPVYAPKQRYNVYSRHWTSSIDDNVHVENNTLPISTNRTKQPNTWRCLILSVLLTVLFYTIFVAAFSVIAVYLYRVIKDRTDEIEMKYMNRTIGI